MLMRRFRRAKRRGWLTRAEFLAACHWKSPRWRRWCETNSAAAIRRVTGDALRTRSEYRRMALLQSLKGVSIPTASAIMTMVDPQRYGVIDIRVWQLLHALGAVRQKPRGIGFRFHDWDQYVSLLRHYARTFRTTARLVEITLFHCHRAWQQGTLYARSDGSSVAVLARRPSGPRQRARYSPRSVR
ncbi:MAG: hypothetical protein ACREKS_02930 [Candidatus Rokuibacteriota bacterium]